MARPLACAVLAALCGMACPAAPAHALDIGSGNYSKPLYGPVNLSGTVDLTMSAAVPSHTAALTAAGASGPVTGTVKRLMIRTGKAYSFGIFSDHGSVRLNGPVSISTGGNSAHGVLASLGEVNLNGPLLIRTGGSSAMGLYAHGPGASIALRGPADIATSGPYAAAVFSNDTSDSRVGLDMPGPNILATSGENAQGVYLFGGIVRLGDTRITTTGSGSSGVYALGGALVLNGSLSIRVRQPDAFALLVQGRAPYTDNVVTTRLRPGVPNPQKLDIEGPVRVYGTGNKLELDLAPGSHLNSRILEADNAGVINLTFFGSDAQWTTGMGSTIHNGAQLNLDFSRGGVWNLPVTDASSVTMPSPALPLFIQDTGVFTLSGGDSLRVLPSTGLAAGQSGTYALVQSERTLPAGLPGLKPLSGSLLYRADSLFAADLNGLPTLQARVTRLRTSEALPDLDPDTGGLLPDGSDGGRPDDGSGNPFLSLALAQHLNGLTLDEITSALEGGPALVRALPVLSLTGNLERRIRQSSPLARLYGRGPERNFSVASSAASGLAAGDESVSLMPEADVSATQVWLSPLYLHEEENVPQRFGRSSRYRGDLGGMLAGASRRFGSWTLGAGLSMGGGRTGTTGRDLPRTTGQVRYVGGLAYGLWERDAWSLGLELNLLSTWTDLSQDNPVMPLKAAPRVDGMGVEAVAARRMSLGPWDITPNVGVEFSHFKQNRHPVRGRLSNGSEADMFENGTARQNQWRTPVGLKIGRTFVLPSANAHAWLLRPEAHARYIPALGARKTKLRVWRTDAPDIGVILPGTGPDRHTFEAGFGLEAARGPLRLALGYVWQGSLHRNAHFFSGTAGYSF